MEKGSLYNMSYCGLYQTKWGVMCSDVDHMEGFTYPHTDWDVMYT